MSLRSQEQVDPAPVNRGRHRSLWIVTGLGLGVLCGLFFGEMCQPLKIVGDGFIGLLQMTVLPYIVVSLIANIARLRRQQSRRLVFAGGGVMFVLWSIALFNVAILPRSLPQWNSASFFSSALIDEPASPELLDNFIPTNIFASLAANQVPAVVLLCILIGAALAVLPNREVLIAPLDVMSRVFVRISGYVVRLTPIGVFAIAAHTAGTMSLAEAGRLQAYLILYSGGSLLLMFVVLPLLITTLTPFSLREVFRVARDAMITAFATGKLIVVLPLLIEQTEELFARARQDNEGDLAPTVDVLYPVAYPFPHCGKLLGMLFIPFAAWFLGSELQWDEYPGLLVGGLFSYFGGPLLATPFLLDQMHLPHDMFQLFLVSGVVCGRLSDALGAMHLVAFTIITTCLMTGSLQLRVWPLVKYLLGVTALGVLLVIAMRITLRQTVKYVEPREQIIANMQLLQRPVESTVFRKATPNPDPLQPGESVLARIRRRGVIRVGYNEDKLPFAYFNVSGELVGLDINLAHALARDLGVRVEFVRFDRETLADQLNDDDFDLVMSGLVGTLERAEAMLHTKPYLDVTLSLVVPDYRVRSFKSFDSMREIEGLKIGFVDLSRGFVDRFRAKLPNAELIELSTSRQFFEQTDDLLDGLLISAESGSAFTLLYPEYEVVIPDGPRFTLPLFYAVGGRDIELRDFLEHWVTLRQKNGTLQEVYDHWVLGKSQLPQQPRWSILRNVLGWVP